MIKIGMIGMSTGNAHPFSWSSIINGEFDSREINNAGFPAVSDYLEANKDTLGISGAKVTHIWCDDKNLAESISKSSGIDHVVDEINELVSKVDGVILGRDDPNNHWVMAKPFIDANVPIFIDKPLTISNEELNEYQNFIDNGKFIMSCSSMRYSNELLAAKSILKRIGQIHLLTVVGKKDWTKYGVHMVEATLSLLNDPMPISVQYIGKEDYDIVLLEINDNCFATIHLINDISPVFQLSVFGEKEWITVDIKNSYSMFKENILEFIKSISLGKPTLDFDKTSQVIKTVIAAIRSKELGGKKINI